MTSPGSTAPAVPEETPDAAATPAVPSPPAPGTTDVDGPSGPVGAASEEHPDAVAPESAEPSDGEATAEERDAEPAAPAPRGRGGGEPAERVPDHDLVGALEAVLLILDNPATAADLAVAVGHTPQRVTAELEALADRYTSAGSGIELREIGGGWRFWTRDRFAPIVERFVLDGAQGRLSKAALESLAVVAYRQPVTRARVSAVRGVNVDGVFRTLTARGLIEEAGSDPDSSAILYRTTPLFLDRMGLTDLAELPSLGPLLPEAADLDQPLDSALDRALRPDDT